VPCVANRGTVGSAVWPRTGAAQFEGTQGRWLEGVGRENLRGGAGVSGRGGGEGDGQRARGVAVGKYDASRGEKPAWGAPYLEKAVQSELQSDERL